MRILQKPRRFYRRLGFFGHLVGLMPCFRAHSCWGSHQFAPHHPQVGQGKQRDELCRALLQASVAHFYKAELALDHPKGMFYLGPDVGL